MRFEQMETKGITAAVVGVIGIIVLLMISGNLIEVLNADEVMVCQSVRNGNLTWYLTPGPKPQLLGKCTHYPRRDLFEFQETKVQFNDGGGANMSGSIQYEIPTTVDELNLLHSRFGDAESVKQHLIKRIIEKAVIMTGPLMSSRESYAEKKPLLISYIEDQAQNGVYKTRTYDKQVTDEISGQVKTVAIVEILRNKSNEIERQERSVAQEHGIELKNFSVSDINYQESIIKQINKQQEIVMEAQTAVAAAKTAEQRAYTAEQQGKASAAEAKWKQEAIKAQAVTQAQQEREVAELQAQRILQVATLDAQTALQEKNAKELRAQGEAAYKKAILAADNALEQRLNAYIKVNELYASAIAQHQGALVPSVMMGSQSGTPNAGLDLMSLFTAKTARDLSVDLMGK